MDRSQYYQLDPDKLRVTVTHLGKRIDERFPKSGLSGVCVELVQICKNGRERSEWIGRPIWPLRGFAIVFVTLLLILIPIPFLFLKPTDAGSLDYCSEMLSLTGKIASLYLNHFEDQAAIAAVNEIENLTTGLSRKIWQKIMISQSLSPDDPAATAVSTSATA